MSTERSHVDSLNNNKPLVVCFDDNETVLDVLASKLKKAGFRVSPTQVDGFETPEELKKLVTEALEKNPFAVITDYDMKERTGKEVLDLYNAHYNNPATDPATKPSLFLYTGEADFMSAPGQLSSRAEKEGFENVFGKLDANEMIKVIGSMLTRNLPPR